MPAKTAKVLVNTQDSWTAKAFFGAFQGTDESPRQKVEGGRGTDILSAPVGPFFDLHLALGEATRPHQDLIGNSNKVCGREFRARPFVAVVSILDDKDAAGMLRALLGNSVGAVFTSSQNPRALPPATLASLAGQLDGPPSEIVPDPRAAVARARELAGPEGAVVVTGSIYLVADLLSEPGRRRASAL